MPAPASRVVAAFEPPLLFDDSAWSDAPRSDAPRLDALRLDALRLDALRLDAARLDAVRLRDAAVREPPPLRELPDRARVPLDLVLEPLVPFRDFERAPDAREDPLDDDFRWVLDGVAFDDERALA